jgi:glycosyltransferase involved in cell wall biosynthesis
MVSDKITQMAARNSKKPEAKSKGELVSIIIPTYNEEKYLPQLLKSITRQEYSPYEIIVSDNRSKDMTRQIAESYGARIVSGGRPARGRNNGALAAKGGILLFLDSDVVLSKGFLESAVKEFQKKRLTIAVAGIKAKSRKMSERMLFRTADLFIKAVKSFRPYGAGCCGIMVRANTHKKIKGFNEKYTLGEDTDYIERAAKRGKFNVLDAVIYVSPRRLRKEGQLYSAMKYTACTVYDFIGLDPGEKQKRIPYQFGHYNKKKKREI